MKKRLVLFIAALPLFSCASSVPYVPYEYGELVTTYENRTGNGYSTLLEYDALSYKGGKLPISYSEIYNDGRRFAIPSTGEQKILVIPVDFEQFPGETAQITAIQQAFFGDTGELGSPSLASYFNQSSYGRLHIKGKVASSWFRPEQTYAELLANNTPKKNKEALSKIYADALTWYDANNPLDPSLNYAYEDGRGNQIVPVSFVYNAPYSGESGGTRDRYSMFWAFTIDNPAPISWTSFDMLNQNGNWVDAHTAIHEFGHMLGLPDYYNTHSSSTWDDISPLGRVDMMDCSLGDHNPLSKLLLNWVRPILIEDECDLYLHSFANSGEMVLLKQNHNKTPFDEYLAIEFYTPSRVNAIDVLYRDDPTIKMLPSPGVIAYKIDARLGLFSYGSSVPSSYLTSESEIGDKEIGLYNENGTGVPTGEAIFGCTPLVQLLEGGNGSATLTRGFVGSDHNENIVTDGFTSRLRDVYFHEGSGINEEFFTDFAFHDGGSLGYSFTVKESTSTYAKLHFATRG